MKVLGVTFDHRLNWTKQVDKVIEKGRKLNSGLKFIRKKLNKEQFLKVLTSQYYGTCFYGCNVWMAKNTYKDVRRLNALHYRSLRIVAKDYKRIMSRQKLDEIGRARPSTWYKFSTTSLVIKVVTRQEPKRLATMLAENMFTERRKPFRPKFFNKADLRIGRQALVNRCDMLMNDLDFDWMIDLTDDMIRRNVKFHLNMITK